MDRRGRYVRVEELLDRREGFVGRSPVYRELEQRDEGRSLAADGGCVGVCSGSRWPGTERSFVHLRVAANEGERRNASSNRDMWGNLSLPLASTHVPQATLQSAHRPKVRTTNYPKSGCNKSTRQRMPPAHQRSQQTCSSRGASSVLSFRLRTSLFDGLLRSLLVIRSTGRRVLPMRATHRRVTVSEDSSESRERGRTYGSDQFIFRMIQPNLLLIPLPAPAPPHFHLRLHNHRLTQTTSPSPSPRFLLLLLILFPVRFAACRHFCILNVVLGGKKSVGVGGGGEV